MERIAETIIDDTFDRVESIMDICNREQLRRRTIQIIAKLDALDARECHDMSKMHAELVGKAKAIMSGSISSPLTIAEVAEECSTSSSMLKQTFRAVEGVPIYQWYRARRIERAKELLCETDLPIAQIALAVGYSNPSKFAKAFRDEVGDSPRAWRDAHKMQS